MPRTGRQPRRAPPDVAAGGSPHEHQRSTQLAARAATRVAEIAPETRRSEHLIAHAVHPAFLEIRNLLNVLLGDIALLGSALDDVAPLLDVDVDPPRSADARAHLFRALREALITNQDLRITHQRLDATGTKLTSDLLALEASLHSGADSMQLAEAVDLAGRLARHVTSTVGGVRWRHVPPDTKVAGSRVTTVAALVAALRLIAEQLGPGASAGIDGSITPARDLVAIRLRAPDATADVYRNARAALDAYARSGIGLSVSATEACVTLAWSRTVEAPRA